MAVLGLLAVAAAMLLRPAGAPPLYDGLGFPDEFYRWVQPPAGAPATPPVTAAAAVLSVQPDGTNVSALVKTGELGPQLQLFVSSGSFQVPAGAKSVTVRADPVTAPGPPPGGAVPAGNAYSVHAEADNGPVTLKLAFLAHFRADKATDQRVVLHRWTDGGWQQIVTAPAGTDVYAGLLAPPATYQLFRMAPTAKLSVEAPDPTPVPTWYSQIPAKAGAWEAADQPRVSDRALWIVVGAAVVLLAAGLLLARVAVGRRRGEGSATAPTDPEPSDPEPSNPEPSNPEPSDPEPSNPGQD